MKKGIYLILVLIFSLSANADVLHGHSGEPMPAEDSGQTGISFELEFADLFQTGLPDIDSYHTGSSETDLFTGVLDDGLWDTAADVDDVYNAETIATALAAAAEGMNFAPELTTLLPLDLAPLLIEE
ncbi:MAG: hypothetical protein ACO20W_06635 [Anaerohalosphaeraceae bacterium]